MPPVNRGLIGTENRLIKTMRPRTADDAVDAAMARLQAAGPHDYVWRERMEWASGLYHGDPDIHGRRVFSEAGLKDCRYVARIARAAYRKGELPASKSDWGRLRESIRRIYEDLEAGRQ